MNNLICLYSYLGRQNMYLACPAGTTHADGVSVVNKLIQEAHDTVHETLAPGATGGQFQSQVATHLMPLLKSNGFTLIDLDKLPRTAAWNN